MTTPAYPTITEELLAELEASASVACQYSSEDWFSADNLWATMERDDAAYVATAKPWTILALLQHVRELKADRARLDSGMIITQERDGTGHEYKCHRRGLDLRAMIDEAAEEARSPQ